MTQLYFAYGANLNRAGMAHRCPAAQPVTSFYLQGWRLAFSGVATVVPAPGESVPGALWAITDQCEISLDHFEGYPDLYRKHWLHQAGYDIMFYVMNTDQQSPPGQSYFRTIEEGYDNWSLPTLPLRQALEESYSLAALDCTH